MKEKPPSPRNLIAYLIVGSSAVSLVVLAVIAIYNDKENTMTIFNMVLPVFASWVGTVLAFYFGRENFESANNQVRKIIEHLSPEERLDNPVKNIMRSKSQIITCPTIEENLITIKKYLSDNSASRLIVMDNEVVKYIIHTSSIDRYIAEGGVSQNSLREFIDVEGKSNRQYGPGNGFITVHQSKKIKEIKEIMLQNKSIQDVIITEDGSSNSAMLGWVSNIRISKFTKE